MEALVQLKPWSKEIEVALVENRGDNFLCARWIEMEQRKQGEIITPAFTLDPQASQRLMDDLWRCGYRPSEGEGSAGQLASVKYHLEDMRKLVFKGASE
jgi:hypothetical protein